MAIGFKLGLSIVGGQGSDPTITPDHPDVLSYIEGYNSVALVPITETQKNQLNTAFSTPWFGGIKWNDYKQKILGLWFPPATEGDVAAITKTFKGFNIVNNNFVAGDCKPYAVQGASNKYLNLNFNPYTGLPNPNSAGLGIFNSSRTYTDSNLEFGGYVNSANTGFGINTSGFNLFSSLFYSIPNQIGPFSPVPEVGTKCVIRYASNDAKQYSGTSLIRTHTLEAGTPPNCNVFAFARNAAINSSTIAPEFNFLESLFSFYVFQEALTESEWFSFNALLNYLYTARGGKFSSGLRIAFDGDSISAPLGGYSVRTSLPHQTALRYNDLYNNYAVSGQTIVQMASNINTHLAENSFNAVVLFGGTNDLATGITGTEAYNRAVNLVQTIKASYTNLPIVWVTTLFRDTATNPDGINDRIAAFNALVRNDDSNFPFVADANAIPELQNSANTTYFLDNLHPTVLGLSLISQTLQPVLNNVLVR
jgi:lysophospholipase L1-like esterase